MDPDTNETLSACPRGLLQRVVASLKEEGLEAYAGAEVRSAELIGGRELTTGAVRVLQLLGDARIFGSKELPEPHASHVRYVASHASARTVSEIRRQACTATPFSDLLSTRTTFTTSTIRARRLVFPSRVCSPSSLVMHT